MYSRHQNLLCRFVHEAYFDTCTYVHVCVTMWDHSIRNIEDVHLFLSDDTQFTFVWAFQHYSENTLHLYTFSNMSVTNCETAFYSVKQFDLQCAKMLAHQTEIFQGMFDASSNLHHVHVHCTPDTVHDVQYKFTCPNTCSCMHAFFPNKIHIHCSVSRHQAIWNSLTEYWVINFNTNYKHC